MSRTISGNNGGITLSSGDSPVYVTGEITNTTGDYALYGPGTTSGSLPTFTITNSGTIRNLESDAVGLGLGNFSTHVGTSQIINESGGLISSVYQALLVHGPGSLTNMAGGTITATSGGTFATALYFYHQATILNAGLIASADGLALYSDGSASSVTNLATGTIGVSGGSGIDLNGPASTLTNAGTITGQNTFSNYNQYGAPVVTGAVWLGQSSSRLIVDPGASFTGLIGNGTSASGNVIELASAASAGTLAGFDGTSITNFGTLQFDSGADWTVSGTSAASGLGSIIITGFTTGDTIDLTGFSSSGMSKSFNSNALTLTNGSSLHATLHMQGSFSASNFITSADSGSGTDIVFVGGGGGTPTLAYGQTLDQSGIVATSETVTAGVMTLFNSGSTAVGTLAVGTSLSTGDFLLAPDGGSGTDVIVDTVFGTYTSGVTLLTVPTTIAGSGQATNAASSSSAVAGPTGTAWTVTNQGTVAETGAAGIGISLAAGGTISNAATATVSAAEGVSILGATGSVSNQGMIIGTSLEGVYLLAGSVSNASGATITAHSFAVQVQNAGATVTNLGQIITTSTVAADAVSLNNGGVVTNGQGGSAASTATMQGPNGIRFGGIVGETGTLRNFGTVIATNDRGVYLLRGGAVYNGQSGATGALVQGVTFGIISPGTVMVANFGTVNVTNTAGYSILLANGTISNLGSASLIEGPGGIKVLSSGTVTNAGTIESNQTTSGVAALFGTGSNRLIVDPGAVFVGSVSASTSATASVIELASGSSAGTLGGFGASITNFTSLVFDSGAAWTVGGTDSANGLGTLGITGFTLGDTIDLAGFVATGETFASNSLVLSGTSATQATLAIQGSFSTGDFTFASDGNLGTDIFLAPPPPPDLLYGQTLDQTGIVATSETVTAGVMTLFNSGSTAVGTLAVGTSLSTGDFLLAPDGGSGTDVIVDTVFGTYTSGVTLLTVPTTIAGSGQATNAATSSSAVAGPTGTAWTVINQGTVAETGAAGTGISLAAGGTISNAATATVSAAEGVSILGATGSVSNQGTIIGTSAKAVYLLAGSVTNAAGAAINGSSIGVQVHNAGATVTNLGEIITSSTTAIGHAVSLNNGGVVTNGQGGSGTSTALVQGDYGVAFFGTVGETGTLHNFGTVIGNGNRGVYLLDGGAVYNGQNGATGALIQGVVYGINSPPAATVDNFGTIISTTTLGNRYGILIGSGNVSNLGSASLIEGLGGIEITANGTVTNAGTIESTRTTSGVAALFGTGSNRLIVDPGAVFVGSVSASTSATASVIELASGSSAGTLSGFGASITNFTSLVFDSGAAWTVGGTDSANGLGTLGITGFTLGDTIDLAGFVATGETFASNSLVLSGTSATQATLAIQGSFSTGDFTFASDGNLGTDIFLTPPPPPDLLYGQTLDQTGIVATSETVTAGVMTLFNSGSTAVGTLAVGTSLSTGDFLLAPDGGSGTDVVVDTVFGSYSSALTLLTVPTTIAISGHAGDSSNSGAAITGPTGTAWTVTNQGVVADTGVAGYAIKLLAGGLVINANTVVGSAGTGVDIVGGAGSVINQATIAGGSFRGVYLSSGSVSNAAGATIYGDEAGVQVHNANGTVTNLGQILGGVGYAVSFTHGGVVTNGQDGSGTSTATMQAEFGVYFSGSTPSETGTLNNFGTIIGTQQNGVALDRGGAVYNGETDATGALLQGVTYGIHSNYAVVVGNFGTIDATGVSSADIGIRIGSGTVSNLGSASLIEGYTGISFGSDGTVTNAGTIASTEPFYFAVAFGDGTNRLIVDPGAVFGGGVSASSMATASVVELASGSAAGTLAAFGANITNFSSLVFDSGAAWTVRGNDSPGGLGTMGISGFTVGDTIDLTGFIAVSETFANNSLVLTDGTSGTATLAIQGSFSTGDFALALDGSGGTDIFLQQPPDLVYGQTLDQSGIVATSETVTAGVMTLFNSGSTAVGSLAVGTSLSSGDFLLAPDGGSGTDVIVNTVFGSYSSGVTLSVTSTTIAGSGQAGNTSAASAAVAGPSGTAWTLTNQGTVAESGAASFGISLAAGGTVSNAVTATVSAATGVSILGAAGSVMNQGSIIATLVQGVYLLAGSISNAAGATIYGAFTGVQVHDADASVANLGEITAATGVAVDLSHGGVVTNGQAGSGASTALVRGFGGIILQGTPGETGTVNNFGTVIGTLTDAVFLQAGGAVYNGLSGATAALLQGAFYGIFGATAVTVDNFGTIGSPGTVSGEYGIKIGSGTVSNLGSVSLIEGHAGIKFTANGTVTNAGTIESNQGTSGVAALFGTGSNRLIVDPGAVFVGSVSASTSATASVIELASGSSAGTLGGFGGSITNFTSLVFDSGAAWTVGGTDSANGLGTLGITGFTLGDTIDLAGFVATGETFASNSLVLSGTSATQATLAIQGSFSTGDFTFASDGNLGTDIFLTPPPPPDLLYGQTLDQTGIVATSETVTAGVMTLFNSGSTAVGTLAVGTSLSTGDFLLAPDGGSGTDVIVDTVFGSYSSQVTLLTVPATIASSGTINASGSTVALYGVGGGSRSWTITNAGVVNGGQDTLTSGIKLGNASTLVSTSAITNLAGGTITGYYGIQVFDSAAAVITIINQAGGTIAGGEGGVDLAINAGTVINSGVIRNVTTTEFGLGVALSQGGLVVNNAGGTITGYGGVYGSSGVTVVNAGTIICTNSYAVGIAGDGTLIVDPGAVFGGAVLGGFSPASTSTLELASAASAGTLMATNFTNFSTIDFDSGAAWTLGGSTTALSGSIVGFTYGDTIDLTGFAATSETFANNSLVLSDGTNQQTLAIQGSFSTGDFMLAADGDGGTDIFLTLPPDLVYGQTLDQTGIVAVSETVTAGVMTLFNGGGTAVGTLAVGTSLSSGDFLLAPDGASGTDVIVDTVFGTYNTGVTLSVVPTTIASSATINVSGTFTALYGPGGGSNSWTIDNFGVLNGGAGSLHEGGILLGRGFTYITAGVITNQSGGTISGRYGILVFNTGAAVSIVNMSGGTIISTNPTDGCAIDLEGGPGTVTNAGLIQAGTVSFLNTGVVVDAGGVLINLAGGTISGGTGVYLEAGYGATVLNAGTIIGRVTSAYAISLADGDRLIADPGAVFIGAVDGGFRGGSSTLELASGASAGTLMATNFTNFSTIDFDSGAAWTLGGSTTALSGSIVGFAFGDTIDLTGFAAISETFANNSLVLSDGTNQQTLAIQGSFSTGDFMLAADGDGGTDIFLTPPPDLVYGQTLDQTGIVAVSETVTAGVMTLFNGGGTAVGSLAVGTSLSSGDFLLAPDGASGTDVIVDTVFGTYNTGVTLSVLPTTIASSATINVSGTFTALYGPGGGSNSWTIDNFGVLKDGTGSLNGSGILLGLGDTYITAGVITNQSGGTISGAYGILVYNTGTALSIVNLSGGTIISNNPTKGCGIDVEGGPGTVTNAGLILAGTVSSLSAGVVLDAGGVVINLAGGTISGGDGVYLEAGYGATVLNAGTIIGRVTSGYAISLADGDRLIADPGAVFIGAVDGGFRGGSSTLELASGASAGTLMATNFTNFSTIDFDSGAAWTLGGSTTALSGSIVGFTRGDTIDLTGFAATSETFANNSLILSDGTNQQTLAIQGSFATGDFTFAADGDGGTDIFLTPPPDLVYGQTIDRAGIIATSETVTAGVMTLFNGATAVGTLAVGTTLSSGDFILRPDGASGTDVIVDTVFGTYGNGVRVSVLPTTIAASGSISVFGGYVVYGPGGQEQNWTVNNFGVVNGGTKAIGIEMGSFTTYDSYFYGTFVAAASITNQAGGTIIGLTGINVISNESVVSIVNQAGGTIIETQTVGSGGFGIYLMAIGTVTNSGLIQAETASVLDMGVHLYHQDTLINTAGGTITGIVGVYASTGSTVVNAGTIIGQGTDGGIGVELRFGDRLIVDPGAVFGGLVTGGAGGGSSVLELASGASAGTLVTTNFTAFNEIDFDAGAAWTLGGSNLLLSSDIVGFTFGDTIDLTGFAASSETFAGNSLVLSDGVNFETLALSGSFSTGDFTLASDGDGGTDIFLTPPPELFYGLTIDQVGIAATSETVTDGILTLFNGATAVGTIAVGTSLTTGDFILHPDGASGTDVIVSTVFGTYIGGVQLLTIPTTIASTAVVGYTGIPGDALTVPAGTNWSVVNFGLITSAQGPGITVQDSGFIGNASTILGGSEGISDFNGPVFIGNAGLIQATDGHGVLMEAGGLVYNYEPGVISGSSYGIDVTNGSATILNIGTILASAGHAVYLYSGLLGNEGLIQNQGSRAAIYAAESSLITNTAGGTISGSEGVYFAPGQTEVLGNGGTIIGSNGTAVAFAGAGSHRLIVDPGAVFTGAVYGGNTLASAVLELASGGSAGIISGLGGSITNFTSLVFDTGAQWTVSGNDLASGLGTLSISGFASGDTIDLIGFAAAGKTFASNALVLNDGGTGTATLAIQGTFSTGSFVLTPDGDGGTDIFLQAPPPVISGTGPGQPVGDNATLNPFSGVTITDPNPGQSETVTITVTSGETPTDADGTLSGAGLIETSPGVYTLTAASPAAISTALAALVFTPTGQQVAPGETVTTGFSLTVTDTLGASASDTGTSVIATAVNDPPAISGTGGEQAVEDNATLQPFSDVGISDPDVGATESVTITLTADGLPSDADGTLSGPGLTRTGPGTYTLATGTPGAVTSELDALVFTPTEHQVAPGQTITTGMTLAVTDGLIGSPIIDTITSVIATAAVIPCFAAGTRIATARGAVVVERLREGDMLLTVSGAQRPVQWIGRRVVDCRRHISPERVKPIRIAAHAFGENRPVRPLLLSPDHSVFVEDVLIPVKHLVNGTTITQVDVKTVTYYHIELPVHDVVLAEGLPAETYLETGGRCAFENGGGALQLHPDFAPDEARVGMVWQSFGYAPLIGSDGQLDRVRARLECQAVMLGYDVRGTARTKRASRR